MGRLHAPETGADPTVKEMGLRDGGFDGWGCGLCRFGLLSQAIEKMADLPKDEPFTSQSSIRGPRGLGRGVDATREE